MKSIATYQNFYFVGIGGIGMSALARYFHSIGKNVLGYDKTPTKLTKTLEQEGLKINYEDVVTDEILQLQQDNSLIIYTPAIKKLSILEYFQKNDFQILKRAKVLGLITENTNCIAIAGTHGKTTTSTLVAHLCKEIDLPFSCFLGGISENFNSNFLFNGNEYSVVEADEYDRSFLNLHPNWAAITSTDADHLDIYGDKETIEKGFSDFANLVKNDQQLFARKGLEIGRKYQSYAVNEKADYYSDNLRMENGKTIFDFHSPNLPTQTMEWQIPGIHNVENATVALAILLGIGAEIEKLKIALSKFKGIKRRFTKHILDNGKIYIDDYAHHPTELDAVIGSAKTFFPNKKLLVVFQPHLYSRTRDFAEDFARSLSNSDELLLLDIYPARELQQDFEGINSAWLLEKIQMERKEVCSLEKALEKIKNKEFDVLLTVGAGNIDTLYDPIMNWLGNK
ncbi:MAG: UDP-N-acetylmuramate--L-alanine ligase [Bacteroidetes bacterium]|jgi:UDP-N-acetylmuramate--alanine ligase|nr:UDP-N-acetylmuramate--L-alanine ligase [Bacteroidota bacterium]